MSMLKGRELLTRPGPCAAIYARISLDKVGEAAGVGRQTEGCSNLAAHEGWNVEHVLIDNDLSAYSGAHRPEYEQLLDLVRRGQIDVIVAYHPDRLQQRLLLRRLGWLGKTTGSWSGSASSRMASSKSG